MVCVLMFIQLTAHPGSMVDVVLVSRNRKVLSYSFCGGRGEHPSHSARGKSYNSSTSALFRRRTAEDILLVVREELRMEGVNGLGDCRPQMHLMLPKR